MDCAAYIIGNVAHIDTLILHGSITRGDYDEKSDVDLFIDTREKKTEEKIRRALENYYTTQTYKNWILKGVKNQFSPIVGNLESDEWKNLKRALMNTGIILYGKYKSSPEKLTQYLLCSFENIKPDNKRIALYRKLFGFTLKKRNYLGSIHEWNAKRIGKGSLLIPVEYANRANQFFKERKVLVKLYDIWLDSPIS